MIPLARISMALWLVIVIAVTGTLSVRIRRGRTFSAVELRRLMVGACLGAVGEAVTLLVGGFWS